MGVIRLGRPSTGLIIATELGRLPATSPSRFDGKESYAVDTGAPSAVVAHPHRPLATSALKDGPPGLESGKTTELSVPETSALIESPNLQRPLPLRRRSDAATNINTGANYFVNPVQLGPGDEL